MAQMIFTGVIFEGINFSEFEGKTYYSLSINGGLTNFKYSIDEKLYEKLDLVPGTLVDLIMGTEVSKATGTVHSTKKVLDVIVKKK